MMKAQSDYYRNPEGPHFQGIVNNPPLGSFSHSCISSFFSILSLEKIVNSLLLAATLDQAFSEGSENFFR
jgi:hypothetical protein